MSDYDATNLFGWKNDGGGAVSLFILIANDSPSLEVYITDIMSTSTYTDDTKRVLVDIVSTNNSPEYWIYMAIPESSGSIQVRALLIKLDDSS